MGASFSEPSPRYSPYTAAVSGQVFLTGGRTKNFDEDKKKLLSSVHTFDVYEESWRERRVEGPAPPGLYWGACTSTPSGNTLQAYGGFDGSHNQGSLDQLDINSLNWTQLSTPDSSGPMKKTGCGMVAYNYKILLFGGKTGIIESTNELHIFDLQEGTWSTPDVSGQIPPPCTQFSFTKVDHHRVVLYGGWQSGRGGTSDLYILDLTTMHWSKVDPQEGEPWPVGRHDHAAVCLGYGDRPQLLVTGGYGSGGPLSDMWLLDVDTGRWREIKEPRHQARSHHSATAITHSPTLVEVILFGGEDKDDSTIGNTVVLLFELNQQTGDWELVDFADKSTLGSRKRLKAKREKIAHHGAGVDVKDSRGRTALISACGDGHTTVIDLLLEKGAHIDSQDDEGYSALMTACQNGHVETTSHLLDRDADTFLKNSEGKTAFDLALESSDAGLLPLFTKLRRKTSYPGILFLEGTKRETISTDKKTIDLEEVGISLSIPENALPSTDPPLQLEVQPCFSGPFDVPQDVDLVSPAYVVSPSRKVAFQKEVLVKIWHHANLESEEDCEDMMFLSASTSPQYRGDTPVYIFKKMRVKGSFRPGEKQPVGQIALKHFCMLAVGKKCKHEDDEQESQEAEPKRSKSYLYSARLYVSVVKKIVFCVCLYHPQYIKNCNKVMAVQYGRSDKKIDLSDCFNGVQITSSEVVISQSCAEGWAVVFKKQPASILKEEISAQEIFDISDLLEMDYPPKIEILIRSVPSSPDSGPLRLCVEGLNRESMFIIHPAELASNEPKQVPKLIDTAMIKSALTELKDEIKASEQSSDTTPVSTLLPIAHEMLSMMEALEQLLQSSGSIHYLIHEMEKKSQQLKESAADILRYVKIKCDMDVSVERANTLAVQMKLVYMSNMQHCNTPEWQCAVGLFVTNAANLMKAIKDTLRASKLARSIPNNILVSSPTFMRPQYILKDNYVLSQPGESPTLHFSVTSDPPLTENTTHVVAARSGDVILRFKVLDNCITFRNVKTTDTGKYTISCHNAKGLEGTATFELDISESASRSAVLPSLRPDLSQHNAANLQLLSSEHYLSQLPIAATQYLDKEIDWDNDYDRDLTEIAKDLLKWEELLAAPFRLTRSDSHRIRSTNQQSPELQMREVLRTWQSKFGLDATYKCLLEILTKANHTEGAKAVCRVLKRRAVDERPDAS